MIIEFKEKSAGQNPRYFRIAAGLLVLYLFLLIFHLGLYDFYQDEARYWWEIRRDIPDLVRWFKRDIHPPLYGVILKLWAELFGRGATSLRALSIICALGAFMVLARLAGKFLSFSRSGFVSRDLRLPPLWDFLLPARKILFPDEFVGSCFHLLFPRPSH